MSPPLSGLPLRGVDPPPSRLRGRDLTDWGRRIETRWTGGWNTGSLHHPPPPFSSLLNSFLKNSESQDLSPWSGGPGREGPDTRLESRREVQVPGVEPVRTGRSRESGNTVPLESTKCKTLTQDLTRRESRISLLKPRKTLFRTEHPLLSLSLRNVHLL